MVLLGSPQFLALLILIYFVQARGVITHIPWGKTKEITPRPGFSRPRAAPAPLLAPVAPTEHVAAPDVHVDIAPGQKGGNIQPKSVGNGWGYQWISS